MTTFSPVEVKKTGPGFIDAVCTSMAASATKGSAIYGYDFCFNLSNNSSQPVTYNFAGLVTSSGNTPIGVGTMQPGEGAQVAFSLTIPAMQAGSVSLIKVGGESVNFQFWSGHGGGGVLQYINILPDNGFQITENTDIQNDATNNAYTVGVGGGGGNCVTTNICITVD